MTSGYETSDATASICRGLPEIVAEVIDIIVYDSVIKKFLSRLST